MCRKYRNIILPTGSLNGIAAPLQMQLNLQRAGVPNKRKAPASALDAMALNGLDEKHGYLMSRIRYASNIDTLWYARTDLMMALAAEHGETRAHDRITAISHLFVGLVPAALAPRLATPPSLRPPPPPPTRPTRLSRLTARRR